MGITQNPIFFAPHIMGFSGKIWEPHIIPYFCLAAWLDRRVWDSNTFFDKMWISNNLAKFQNSVGQLVTIKIWENMGFPIFSHKNPIIWGAKNMGIWVIPIFTIYQWKSPKTFSSGRNLKFCMGPFLPKLPIGNVDHKNCESAESLTSRRLQRKSQLSASLQAHLDFLGRQVWTHSWV